MDLSGSSEVSPGDVTTTTREEKVAAPAAPVPSKVEGPKAAKARLTESKESSAKLYPVEMDHSRDRAWRSIPSIR